MIDSINGNPDDDFVARIVAAAACVEWDVDADGAWDRVREALESSHHLIEADLSEQSNGET